MTGMLAAYVSRNQRQCVATCSSAWSTCGQGSVRVVTMAQLSLRDAKQRWRDARFRTSLAMAVVRQFVQPLKQLAIGKKQCWSHRDDMPPWNKARIQDIRGFKVCAIQYMRHSSLSCLRNVINATYVCGHACPQATNLLRQPKAPSQCTADAQSPDCSLPLIKSHAQS